jgi:hypothetical protein
MSRYGYLTAIGFLVPISTLKCGYKQGYDSFLKGLTIVIVPKIGMPQKIYLYNYVDYKKVKCLSLPRSCSPQLLRSNIISEVKIHIHRPMRLPSFPKLAIELKPNQVILSNYILQTYLRQEQISLGQANVLFNLKAGQGKTFVAAALIASLQLRTAYIVPKKPLLLQAVKDLRLCFGEQANYIGCKDGVLPKKEAGVLLGDQLISVFIINTALALDPKVLDSYDMVIFDEVHTYCSPTRKSIFRKLVCPVSIGMSATTNEKEDKTDSIYKKEFDGDVLMAEDIPGFKYDENEFKCFSKLIYYNGPEEYTQNLKHDSTDMIFTHYMHNQFISDPYRTSVCIDELLELYDWQGPSGEQHCIYVFAEELAILTQARDIFNRVLMGRNRSDVSNSTFIEGLDMFVSKTKSSEMGQIIDRCRVLFSTYGYAGTGVSIPKMTAIMFLTPRKANMEQVLGRILRTGYDVSIPRIVVDIIDTKTALMHQLTMRKAAYKHYGFIKQVKWIAYSDLNILDNLEYSSRVKNNEPRGTIIP